MGLKDKVKGTGSTIKGQLGNSKKSSKYVIEILKSNEVVLDKTDATAILVRKKGNEKEFSKEFDNITKEGYKMILSEEITDPLPVVNVVIGYIYFFQHKKYIN